MKRFVKTTTATLAALCLLAFSLSLSCAAPAPAAPPAPPPAAAAPPPEPESALPPEPEKAPVQTVASDEPKPLPASGLDLSGAKTYRVRYRDTLSSIARRQYGGLEGACYFPIILEASKNAVKNPDRIVPGMVLTIPDLKKNKASADVKALVKTLMLDMAKNYERRRAYPKTVAALRREAAKL
jgi:nucleoid-associated protein YgaU